MWVGRNLSPSFSTSLGTQRYGLVPEAKVHSSLPETLLPHFVKKNLNQMPLQQFQRDKSVVSQGKCTGLRLTHQPDATSSLSR